MVNQQSNDLDVLKLALFYLGYITFVGPPRAIAIRRNCNRFEIELFGKPLWIIVIYELSFRGRGFVIFGFLLELLIGDVISEQLHGDIFLVTLLLIGILHMAAYYMGIGIITPKDQVLGMLVYRVGRNIAYALLCALFVAPCILFYQYLHHIKLFSGSLLEISTTMTFSMFSVIGIVEAIYTRKRIASTIDY